MGKRSQISAHCLNHRAWRIDGIWLENGESHRLFLYSPAIEGIWREEINFQKRELIEAIMRERRWRSKETECVMACRWRGGLMA
jgi:hypothetical protein